jgi:hypothetical protein
MSKVKLRPAQLRAMRAARDHGDPGHGLSGRSAFGGLTWTCASLRRLGLFGANNTLTDAGHALLTSKSQVQTCPHCGNPFEGLNKYCSKYCTKHSSKNRRHGLTRTRLYGVWARMRERCHNPSAADYPRYGGRGIKVCERWEVFENFRADMGEKPDASYSLDRINNDGDYEPSNCRWATKLEQTNNRRNTWTAEEDQKLRDALASGLNFREAATHVGRPYGGTRTRAERLGLKSAYFAEAPKSRASSGKTGE